MEIKQAMNNVVFAIYLQWQPLKYFSICMIGILKNICQNIAVVRGLSAVALPKII